MVLKYLQLSVRSINILKRNCRKQFFKKLLTTSFISGEERQLKGRTLIAEHLLYLRYL